MLSFKKTCVFFYYLYVLNDKQQRQKNIYTQLLKRIYTAVFSNRTI